MTITKELIFTLTLLKDVGVKGIGTKKILAIAQLAQEHGQSISTIEDLLHIISLKKEHIFQNITIENLIEAHQYALSIIKESADSNISLIGYYDDDFPQQLRCTVDKDGKLDPPLLLWYRGDLEITKQPGLAIIGSREPLPEGMIGGLYLADIFAKKGFNIISGLAIGCDTSGHEGALISGKTTAILANGLDSNSIYPRQNKELAERIVEKGGLLLSEYPIGTQANKYNLVARDRLQAGLANATIVIMTSIKGGTMHAATATLKSNKELYVLHYKDEATNSHEKCRGNAALIKQGAKVITGNSNLDDISNCILNNTLNRNTLLF